MDCRFCVHAQCSRSTWVRRHACSSSSCSRRRSSCGSVAAPLTSRTSRFLLRFLSLSRLARPLTWLLFATCQSSNSTDTAEKAVKCGPLCVLKNVCDCALQAHQFFAIRRTNWEAVFEKRLTPPFRPHIQNEEDVSQFDTRFTQEPAIDSPTADNSFLSRSSTNLFEVRIHSTRRHAASCTLYTSTDTLVCTFCMFLSRDRASAT